MTTKTSRILWIIIAVIVVLTIAFAVSTRKKAPETERLIRIGVILPLSGDLAFIGEDTQRGMMLAAKEFDQAEFQFEDNKGNAKDMVSAYQKMIVSYNPDIVIASGVGVEAIIPLAEESKVPLLLTNSSASGLPGQGDYIFRYFTNADVDVPVIAEYAVNSLGLEKSVVLYLQDQFGIDYKNVFAEESQRHGSKVVAEEVFTWTDFDYKIQLTKLKSQEFDSIYIIGLDYQLITILQQIKELGIEGSVLSVGTIATKDSIEKAGNTIEGVHLTAFCTDGAPESYVNKFQKEYNSYPGFFSELGYDMIKMTQDAVLRIGGSREQIKKGLASIKDFRGNAGIVSTDSSGEVIIPMCVKRIESGKIFNTVTGKYSDY